MSHLSPHIINRVLKGPLAHKSYSRFMWPLQYGKDINLPCFISLLKPFISGSGRKNSSTTPDYIRFGYLPLKSRGWSFHSLATNWVGTSASFVATNPFGLVQIGNYNFQDCWSFNAKLTINKAFPLRWNKAKNLAK